MFKYLFEFMVKPVYKYFKSIFMSFFTAIVLILFAITGLLANIFFFGKEWEGFCRNLFQSLVEKSQNGEI